MPAVIRLIATDLDGTLIGSANELPFYTDFNDQLERLHEEHGTLWAACTGRKFSSFWEFFRPMRRMGLFPDYVIVRHSYIYRRTPIGFLPHLVWNVSILIRLMRETRVAYEAIDDWHETLTAGAMGVNTIRRTDSRLSLRFDSPESATVAANLLRQKGKEVRHLHIAQTGTDVDVRTVPATKGLALSELASYLNIEREHVLAIGNGANDVSMLDGTVAGMVGCPANSDAEVIDVVHRAGGHVASQRALRGVMEILNAHAEDAVCSDLPKEWTPAAPGSSPARARTSRRTSGHRHRPRMHPALIAAIVYLSLLAFAIFDAIPFARWIRKPFDLLVHAAAWAFRWI